MEVHRNSPPGLLRAYGVFVGELEAQMRSLKGSLSRDKGVDSACLSELSSALHRIKGGAGFFGLDHIATHAATLEELLLKPLEDVQRNLDRIQQTLKELEGCVEEIPSGAELEEKRRA